MTETQALSEVETLVYSMEDNWLWYIAGSFDTVGRLTVKIREGEKFSHGYYMKPRLTYTRPTEAEVVFGMLDEYCEEQGVNHYVEERESGFSLKISKPESIRRFLNPILLGLVQQRERAEVMLDEILPHFEDGPPKERSEFLEVMEAVETLRSKPIDTRLESKFDLEYFKEKWAGELSGQ